MDTPFELFDDASLALILWNFRVAMNNADNTSMIDMDMAVLIDDIEGVIKDRGYNPDKLLKSYTELKNLNLPPNN